MSQNGQRGGLGPGFVITAAFVGPGTVITCTMAGANFGTGLLWTLLFAGIATVILQEMTMRLSLVSGLDLAESLRTISEKRWLGSGIAILAALGIAVGCAAYQAGNLLGGASGLQVLMGGDISIYVLIQTGVAMALLLAGTYKIIERVLISLVALMSISFILAAALYPPQIVKFLSGLFIPTFPGDSLLTVLALVGTTVVPYNLFLHSRIAREKWKNAEEDTNTAKVLKWGRKDLVIGVGIGIAASLGIMSAASSVLQGGNITSISTMAEPLRKMMGPVGGGLFGLGLWAAGMTSAITAPLAAAYAFSGAAGWGRRSRDSRFITVWLLVLISGLYFAITSATPVLLIVTAQALNGIILPFAALFLIIAMNNKKRLALYANSSIQNTLGIIVLIIVFLLAASYLWKAFAPFVST